MKKGKGKERNKKEARWGGGGKKECREKAGRDGKRKR